MCAHAKENTVVSFATLDGLKFMLHAQDVWESCPCTSCVGGLLTLRKTHVIRPSSLVFTPTSGPGDKARIGELSISLECGE